MRITRRHKMYVRPHIVSDSVRNLAKASPALYVFVFKYMTNKRNIDLYNQKNKNVKSWKEWKPIDIVLDQDHSEVMKELTKKKHLTVYYDGSWRPLVKLHLYKA